MHPKEKQCNKKNDIDEKKFSAHIRTMMISKLRTWRKSRKLTLQAFSERTGLAVGHLCKLERGQQWPGPKTMAVIEKHTRGAVTAADIVADYQAAKRETNHKAA